MSSTKFRAPTFSLVSSRRLPHCRSLLHTTLLKTKPISRMPRHRAQATELEKCCQFLIGSNDESLSVVAARINDTYATLMCSQRSEEFCCGSVASLVVVDRYLTGSCSPEHLSLSEKNAKRLLVRDNVRSAVFIDGFRFGSEIFAFWAQGLLLVGALCFFS